MKSGQMGVFRQPQLRSCHMETAYIGLGSNMGDKGANCVEAVTEIGKIPGCRLISQSELFLTKPVGVEGQDWYVNGVVSVAAGISPGELLTRLLTIEAGMGRIRRHRWEARIIDLDLLLYGREVIAESDLTVPHPRLHLRRFVLAPLARLAPDLVHPTLGKTISDLLRDLGDDDQVAVPLKDS